jgi:hypothetical protein
MYPGLQGRVLWSATRSQRLMEAAVKRDNRHNPGPNRGPVLRSTAWGPVLATPGTVIALVIAAILMACGMAVATEATAER